MFRTVFVVGLLLAAGPAAAQDANQFGLQCGNSRLNIDLSGKRWCEVQDDGSCPVETILKVSPSRIDLKDYVKDNTLENRSNTHVVWYLDRATGKLEIPPFFSDPCEKVAYKPISKPKF